jgi:hypothetical protein
VAKDPAVTGTAVPLENVGLRLQLMNGPIQTLAMTHAAALRERNRRASTQEIVGLYDALRIPVPPPSTLRTNLSRLRSSGALVGDASGWAVSPAGSHRLSTDLSDMDLSHIPDSGHEAGAQFAGALHRPVSHMLAPASLQAGINRLVDRFPWDQNVFLITRYPSNAQDDPIATAISVLRDTVEDHGLHLHLASDRKAEDTLFGNVGAHMWGCRYGIALLEDRLGDGLNQNVLIELGGMLITGRRCAVIKDRTAPDQLPSDLVDRIYDDVDLNDATSLQRAVHDWIANDLALGTCAQCPKEKIA